MRKSVHLILLSLIALLTYPTSFGVEGAILRANQDDQQGDERQAKLNNVAVERELQRRQRNGGGKGKGKGKGKGGSSKGANLDGLGRRGRPIRFLPDRIEPIPFVNCIPLPPGFDIDDGMMMGKAKGRNGGGGSSKGKGGKGKGNRRNARNMIRERVLKHRSSYRGRIRNGRNRGGNRNGARRNGAGMEGPKKMKMMMMARLPFCPQEAPTFFPTALPSFTPIPTSTPLPSITPFPSFTPFPTEDDGSGPGPADGPTIAPGSPTPAPNGGTPGTPGTPGPGTPATPTAINPGSGVPVAIPDGTTRILVESTLEYRLFDTATPRQPTQEEIDGVLAETTRFYTDLLTTEYQGSNFNFDSFEAKLVSSDFNAGNNLPIKIDFDANAFFTGENAPTPAEVFAVLEGADYQNYITNYVWMSQPQGTIFFETQEVAYNARVSSG